MALASIALVATSEAPPRVSSDAKGQLVLTDQRPEKQLSLAIVISAETFSTAPRAGLLHVSFQAPASEAAGNGEASRLPLRVTYPDGVPREDDAVTSDSCNYGGGEWCGKDEWRRLPLATCAGECRLSVPITVEWTQPQAGRQLTLDWVVSAAIEYSYDDAVPADAGILVEGVVR